MFFECESSRVEQSLQAVGTLLQSNGSVLADLAGVRQDRCGMALVSRQPRGLDASLLIIGQRCLIPVELFVVSRSGDDFQLRDIHPGASALQAALMEKQLEIYNETDKLRFHREISPALNFEPDNRLHVHLFSARPEQLAYVRQLGSQDSDLREVDAFFQTRTVMLPSGLNSKPARCLMPMIDFGNHHGLAPPITPLTDNGQLVALGIRNSQFSAADNEVSYCYKNLSDLHDLYLNYHFVDQSGGSDFLRSIPLSLRLDGIGTINIHAGKPRLSTAALGPGDTDLAFMMPEIRQSSAGVAEVAHLLLMYARAPRSTQRILAIVIGMLAPALDSEAIARMSRTAEAQIIAANKNYYHELAALAEEAPQVAADPLVTSARDIARLQLAILARYADD